MTNGRRRQPYGQVVAHLLDERAGRLDGALHHARQFDPLLAEFQLVAADPAHVHQVIYQPHHLPKLPLYQSSGLLQCRRFGCKPDDLDGVADRGQRIAEFVGQQRQELVLASVGFPKLLVAAEHSRWRPSPSGQVVPAPTRRPR